MQTCFNFLNFKSAGVDFGKSIISTHPELAEVEEIKSVSKRKKEISKYVNQFYCSHKKELKNALSYFSKEWRKVEQSFFKKTDKVFNKFPWPKGKYICYLSIFDCNPRFLHNKTFQVFYRNKKGIKRIITHELLHFIFYDYLEKRLKIIISESKKWSIAEIFNTILLNQNDFKKIISPDKELGYPEHKRYIKLLTTKWKKCKDIMTWLGEAMELVH